MVLGEFGVKRDVEQSARASGLNFRHTFYRFRIEDTVANDPQPACAFRYEHVAVWQPDDAPWMRESFRDNRNLDAGVSLRSAVGPRTLTEFVCRLWRLRRQSYASGSSHANEENK